MYEFYNKKNFDICVSDRAHLKKSFKQVIEEIIMFNYMYIYKFVNVVYYYLFVSIILIIELLLLVPVL